MWTYINITLDCSLYLNISILPFDEYLEIEEVNDNNTIYVEGYSDNCSLSFYAYLKPDTKVKYIYLFMLYQD